jgi:hypothetical protein
VTGRAIEGGAIAAIVRAIDTGTLSIEGCEVAWAG